MKYTASVLDRSNNNIEIAIATPHQFLKEHQSDILPDWDLGVISIILFLQRSQISLKESNPEVIQEKNRLRVNFIRFGCSILFALIDQGYKSDLFDPRNGHPLLSHPGKLTFDDNAAVNKLLHYPVSDYQNCSLIEHPDWKNNVYPATIVTLAAPDCIEPIIQKNMIQLK